MNKVNGFINKTVIFCFSMLLSSVLFAQQNESLKQIAVNKTTEPIEIDGELSEEVWKSAEKGTEFWVNYPEDGKKADPSIQTITMMAYDDNFIYVAAICQGPGPYIIPSRKRDNQSFWNGDTFAVVIDPVNERTNGFMFATNPEGVQYDVLITGQTGTRSNSRPPNGFNVAWDNKWYVETQQTENSWTLEMAIPFKSLRFGNKKEWGVNFIRLDSRSNSSHTWSPVPVQFWGMDLGYTGTMRWDETPNPTKGNISVIPYVSGSSYKDFETNEAIDWKGNAGVDAKVAVTTGLNLDLTVNPDFSQVEVDQQVTNLTAFNVRFPERRLFFLENDDIFSDFGIPPMRPFFSRRIGLDEDGNTIPILFGARLSGNINKNLRIGVMNMQTRESAFPANNYFSTAFHQQVFDRSVIKGYFHNRQGFQSGSMSNADYNRTGGLEFQYRSLDGKIQAFSGYGFTSSPDTNKENYFYNVGGGYNGRNLTYYVNFSGVGDNYTPDMGFVPLMIHSDAVADTTYRIGFNHWYSRLGYNIYPESPKINQHALELTTVGDITTGNIFFNSELEFSYMVDMQNTSGFGIGVNWAFKELLFPFAFTEGEPLPAGGYNFVGAGAGFSTDKRKVLSLETMVGFGGFYNGTRQQYVANLMYRKQPWGNFGLSFEQNVIKFPDPYGEETFYLVGPRAEVNFSRNIFWTTFIQYNTQRENFNINSRFQWRYSPMSDLFIVYTDNYITDIWGPKNRAVVLKLNYWLNL